MKLHRFAYSCYARFAQAVVELAGVPCEIIEVPFGDREALAKLTRGYIQVPVLERDDGTVAETRILTDKFVPVIRAWDMTPGSSTCGAVLTIR